MSPPPPCRRRRRRCRRCRRCRRFPPVPPVPPPPPPPPRSGSATADDARARKLRGRSMRMGTPAYYVSHASRGKEAGPGATRRFYSIDVERPRCVVRDAAFVYEAWRVEKAHGSANRRRRRRSARHHPAHGLRAATSATPTAPRWPPTAIRSTRSTGLNIRELRAPYDARRDQRSDGARRRRGRAVRDRARAPRRHRVPVRGQLAPRRARRRELPRQRHPRPHRAAPRRGRAAREGEPVHDGVPQQPRRGQHRRPRGQPLRRRQRQLPAHPRARARRGDRQDLRRARAPPRRPPTFAALRPRGRRRASSASSRCACARATGACSTPSTRSSSSSSTAAAASSRSRTTSPSTSGSRQQLRQAQKMEAVGRLAGGVAHDFNNILTAMRGHSEILLDACSRPTRRTGATPSRSIASALRAAVADRRSCSRSARKQVLQPRTLDLNALVANLTAMLQRLIGEDVELRDRRSPSARHRCSADPGQLEQVLVNLAVNARDAMPAGGTLAIAPRTSTSTTPPSRSIGVPHGRWVVLAVRDTGVGMDDDHARAHLRAVLHDQGSGQGHRPRPVDRLRHRRRSRAATSTVDSAPGARHAPSASSCRASTRRRPRGPLSRRRRRRPARQRDHAARRGRRRRARLRAATSCARTATRCSRPSTAREALRMRRAARAGRSTCCSPTSHAAHDGLARWRRASRRCARAIKVLYISGYPGDAIVKQGVPRAARSCRSRSRWRRWRGACARCSTDVVATGRHGRGATARAFRRYRCGGRATPMGLPLPIARPGAAVNAR